MHVRHRVRNIAFLKPVNVNLSEALKVFEVSLHCLEVITETDLLVAVQDNGIKDLCVSIDSLHWKVRSISPKESARSNYIYYKCSQEQLPGSEGIIFELMVCCIHSKNNDWLKYFSQT